MPRPQATPREFVESMALEFNADWRNPETLQFFQWPSLTLIAEGGRGDEASPAGTRIGNSQLRFNVMLQKRIHAR
jgi:hypothetical protein